jgi:hypothetical protein
VKLDVPTYILCTPQDNTATFTIIKCEFVAKYVYQQQRIAYYHGILNIKNIWSKSVLLTKLPKDYVHTHILREKNIITQPIPGYTCKHPTSRTTMSE